MIKLIGKKLTNIKNKFVRKSFYKIYLYFALKTKINMFYLDINDNIFNDQYPIPPGL